MSYCSDIRLVIDNKLKNLSAESNKNEFIDLAVKYGIYRAIGGKKLFIFPPYCDVAIKIAYAIAKLGKYKKPRSILKIKKTLFYINNIINIDWNLKEIGPSISLSITYKNNRINEVIDDKNICDCLDRICKFLVYTYYNYNV